MKCFLNLLYDSCARTSLAETEDSGLSGGDTAIRSASACRVVFILCRPVRRLRINFGPDCHPDDCAGAASVNAGQGRGGANNDLHKLGHLNTMFFFHAKQINIKNFQKQNKNPL